MHLFRLSIVWILSIIEYSLLFLYSFQPQHQPPGLVNGALDLLAMLLKASTSCHCLECVRRILMEYVTFGYFFCRYVWCLVTLSIEFYVTRLSCTCHVSLVSNWLCICTNAESTFRSCESSIWCIIQICGCYNHSEHRHKWTSGECPLPVYVLVIEHRYFFTSFIFSLTSCKLLTIFSKLPISNVSFFIELLLYLDLYTLSGDVQLHNELHWPFLTFYDLFCMLLTLRTQQSA